MKEARLQVAHGGLHPDRVRVLYDKYGPKGTVRGIARGSIKTTDRIRGEVSVSAATRREQLSAAGIDVIYKGDPGFPSHLAEMPDSPDLLFVRGRLFTGPAVAVVGTRRCTAYGRRIAHDYGHAIAAAGWPLVSGLARGIDGAAHAGTIAGGGVGLAVLGSGIDVMYPPEHADLAIDLLDNGGGVVSESPPGTPPEAWRFPPRNRIISGLVEAVVVVEATVKGGALITADAGLRHGRQVFAVPGDISRASSAGCNLLIRDGAAPVHDVEDLVESLELVLGPAPGHRAQQVAVDAPTGLDHTIIELLRAGVTEVDEILSAAGASPGAVLAALGGLEIAGLVCSDIPGQYSLATTGGEGSGR